jgi:hypothetical protein
LAEATKKVLWVKSARILEAVPYVVNLLTVAISDSGKERLVLDLRHVNRYIEKQKVKFEGVNEAKQYAKQGNYAVKFDLKSGYHHIDIHPDHQQFLGFSWNFDGVQKYFVGRTYIHKSSSNAC